jgi:hypothetical protein
MTFEEFYGRSIDVKSPWRVTKVGTQPESQGGARCRAMCCKRGMS